MNTVRTQCHQKQTLSSSAKPCTYAYQRQQYDTQASTQQTRTTLKYSRMDRSYSPQVHETRVYAYDAENPAEITHDPTRKNHCAATEKDSATQTDVPRKWETSNSISGEITESDSSEKTNMLKCKNRNLAERQKARNPSFPWCKRSTELYTSLDQEDGQRGQLMISGNKPLPT